MNITLLIIILCIVMSAYFSATETAFSSLNRIRIKKAFRKYPESLLLHYVINSADYPPKLSYMIEDSSTPRLSSIATTAFDIGPGPHM